MKLKIGVLSDTHIHSVTEELRRIKNGYLSDVDYVLHAGDIVSMDVVAYLDDGNFFGVHGNMDSYYVREFLPEKRILEFGGVRLGLMHGCGSKADLEDRISREFQDVDVIVYGHTHVAANHSKDGVLVFNPGTAIGYASSGPHTIGIIEIDNDVTGRIIEI